MEKLPKQSPEAVQFTARVFSVAVARGDWKPEQRLAFELVQARHGWWYQVGPYDRAAGWNDRAPWKGQK